MGTTYINREALSDTRVHGPNRGGLWGGKDGRELVVVSGGYVDEQDYGDVIIYTGHGKFVSIENAYSFRTGGTMVRPLDICESICTSESAELVRNRAEGVARW